MLLATILLFVSSILAIAIDPSSPSLLQPGSNVSTLRSPPRVVSPTRCTSRSVYYQQNVRAIDCLNVFTFILATEHHAREQTFTVPPDVSSSTVAYSRRSGTCKLDVSIIAGVTMVVSSFDEILQAALRVVGLCLLDNRPDSMHCTLPS
jgi:hypothetical protein